MQPGADRRNGLGIDTSFIYFVLYILAAYPPPPIAAMAACLYNPARQSS